MHALFRIVSFKFFTGPVRAPFKIVKIVFSGCSCSLQANETVAIGLAQQESVVNPGYFILSYTARELIAVLWKSDEV